MRETSIAPTGLSVAKSGGTFSCSWKSPSSMLAMRGDQEFWSNTGGNESISPTTANKAVTVNFGNYFPNGSKLSYFRFGVRCRGGGDKFSSRSWLYSDPYSMQWSEWAYAQYNLAAPPVPTITVEKKATRQCKFSWSCTPGETQPFTDILVQTVLVHDGASPDWNNATTWTTGSSGSWDTAESGVVETEGHSYTRWFRVASRGAAGQSEWAYQYHTYSFAKQSDIKKIDVKENNASGYDVTISWEVASNTAWPVDQVVVQYSIAQPGAGGVFDTGTWTDAYTSDRAKDTAFFKIDAQCGRDQCLFIRVNTKHDENVAQGVATRAFSGKLKDPQLGTVTPDDSDYTVDIASVQKSAVTGAFQVIYYKSGIQGDNPIAIGVIASGSSSASDVQCPDWSAIDDGEVYFGVQAVVGTVTYKTRADNVKVYEVNAVMASDIAWSDGTYVLQITGVSLSKTDISGSIRAIWNWTWIDANCAELSWADHPDAWESTAAPSTFLIKNKKTSAFNIAGLALGKIWYVRVRLLKKDDETEVYTPYSDIAWIDLSSAPDRPLLDLSETVVAQGQDFTASWDYVSTDGTHQESAEIAQFASYAATSPSASIGIFGAEQHADLNANIWNTTGVKYLAVRTKSESGLISPWSDKVPITIATPLTAAISATSLELINVPSDDEEETTRSQLSLTEMPLSVTVTGAGVGDMTSVYIMRTDEYHISRPDESAYDGYAGETIATQSRIGAGSITFGLDDLIGHFDDGAKYAIVAIVQDELGQIDETGLEFEVHWEHQACPLIAEILIDQDNQIAVINVPEPEGAEETDSFDVYRLSADKPELIIQGAAFDTKYVDPYPAIGKMGGHRIVSRTANGDYISSGNGVEFLDIGEADGDTFYSKNAIIEFGGEKVELKYDLDLSSKWTKTFKETHYLGGSVQGDWGKAVSRTGSISGIVVETAEERTIEAMRRLSDYTGACHVRTPEGSSFTADVQVSESWNHDKGGKVAAFSLSVTRVDQEGMDGMTYAAWLNGGA